MSKLSGKIAIITGANSGSGGVRQRLSDDRVADEPDRDDGFSLAAAALAGRAGVELVGTARRTWPGHGLLPELFLPRLGRGIDSQRRHDPAAARRRANIAGRRAGCGGGGREHPSTSDPSHWQGLRTDRAAVPGDPWHGGRIFRRTRPALEKERHPGMAPSSLPSRA